MKYLDYKAIDYLKNSSNKKYVTKAEFGIEKENLRINKNGELATTPHPSVFGDKKKNPYIKTDFSESQIEVITPVNYSIKSVYSNLENLTDIVNNNIGEEILWPQSSPAILPIDEKIPLANFGDNDEGTRERVYREFLSKRYGRKIQMISGIHYNFSFDNKLIETLNTENIEFRKFKDELYMKVSRNALLHRWFLVYLTAASPFVHESYDKKFLGSMERLKDVYKLGDSTSLRNGFCGYRNEEDFLVPWDTVENYSKKIHELVESGDLSNAREFYSAIRLKGKDNKKLLESIEEDGIKYLELRLLDLNPFDKNGISLKTAYLIHLYFVLALLSEDCEYDSYQQEIGNRNQEIVVNDGLSKSVTLFTREGNEISIEDFANHILNNMEELISIFKFEDPLYQEAVNEAREMINDRTKTIAYRVKEEIDKKGYIDFHMELAHKYKKDSYDNDYILHGYEDMELSTQILIKESIKRGLDLEILDRSDNFISLSNDEIKEYVKQATKTSRDSYITVMLMENKIVTKKILDEFGISVPKGRMFVDKGEAKDSFIEYSNKRIVIKPKSTNFGIGITIFKDDFNQKLFEEAIDIAFNFDDSIIIEEFVTGEEYRFLVIGNKVLAVTQRVPANVVGDGKSTIIELVDEKNKDKLRGYDHRKPLEKIQIGDIEKLTLESQGKTINYVPLKGEIVNLRENSNISTGGDSVDYTDEVNEKYKEIAIKSAKSVKATFCGVDLIIDNIKEEPSSKNHSVIELNFNPAYYMHCYPYKGKRRNIAEKILEELELIHIN